LRFERVNLCRYFSDYHKRVVFMRDWLQNGNPKTYWLPGFFFPQGFMTVGRCRLNQVDP
jgi:hypothetical protein